LVSVSALCGAACRYTPAAAACAGMAGRRGQRLASWCLCLAPCVSLTRPPQPPPPPPGVACAAPAGAWGLLAVPPAHGALGLPGHMALQRAQRRGAGPAAAPAGAAAPSWRPTLAPDHDRPLLGRGSSQPGCAGCACAVRRAGRCTRAGRRRRRAGAARGADVCNAAAGQPCLCAGVRRRRTALF
jgi:hypothetical protein